MVHQGRGQVVPYTLRFHDSQHIYLNVYTASTGRTRFHLTQEKINIVQISMIILSNSRNV
jgi:hypothetical protein